MDFIKYFISDYNWVSILFGGWLASFIIGWFWSRYYFKKGIEVKLNSLRDFLKDLHKRQTETCLKMFKNQLVNQLKSDMAEIWQVKPGATVSADPKKIDPHAMENADEKYYSLISKIDESSEKILDDILQKE